MAQLTMDQRDAGQTARYSLKMLDGCFTRLLIVRDLPSHYQLLALPVVAETAQVAADALDQLMTAHGPPLVHKSDNGAALLAPAVMAVLGRHRVAHLPSPIHRPQYNGSVEAGNGALKLRIHHHAALHGHPTFWTSDDVEAARLAANLTLRPWGAHGPTPAQVWSLRPALGPGERRTFQQHLERQWKSPHDPWGLPMPLQPSAPRRAALARAIIRRALVELGYLTLQGGELLHH